MVCAGKVLLGISSDAGTTAEVRDETFAHAYNVIKVLVLHAQRHACVRVMQAWMRWQRLAYESDRFWEQISGSICSLTTGLALRKVRAAWCAWNRYHRNHLALSQAASEKQARYEAVVSHTKVQLLRLLSGDRHRTNGNLRLAFAQLDFHRHRSVIRRPELASTGHALSCAYRSDHRARPNRPHTGTTVVYY